MGSVLALPAAGRLPAAPISGDGADVSAPSALASYLDTLIPPDETPSATEAGVDATLLRMAARDQGLNKLIVSGCGWLDAQARLLGQNGFVFLGVDQRESVVARAAVAERNQAERRFYETTRFTAMRLYYATAPSWKGLGIDASPQPRGYPGHDQAPRPRRK